MTGLYKGETGLLSRKRSGEEVKKGEESEDAYPNRQQTGGPPPQVPGDFGKFTLMSDTFMRNVFKNRNVQNMFCR